MNSTHIASDNVKGKVMSNIVKFGNANLPTAASLAESLRKLDTDAGVGSVILKMDKTGHWVYGADQTEIDKDGVHYGAASRTGRAPAWR